MKLARKRTQLQLIIILFLAGCSGNGTSPLLQNDQPSYPLEGTWALVQILCGPTDSVTFNNNSPDSDAPPSSTVTHSGETGNLIWNVPDCTQTVPITKAEFFEDGKMKLSYGASNCGGANCSPYATQCAAGPYDQELTYTLQGTTLAVQIAPTSNIPDPCGPAMPGQAAEFVYQKRN